MAAKTVYLNWNPDDLFTLKDRDGRQIPVNMGRGIGAADLLSMSLIGCSAYDVVEILKKQRQKLIRLEVRAEAVQDETPPWRFRKIHIHYEAFGKDLDREKVQRAILLSEEKYCSVYATLRDVVEITHDLDVTEI
jgi:putative redox protein